MNVIVKRIEVSTIDYIAIASVKTMDLRMLSSSEVINLRDSYVRLYNKFVEMK